MKPQHHPIISVGLPKIQIVSDRACVVYEPKTGAIAHVHRVVTTQGGYAYNEAELHTRALALAATRGRNVKKLKTLTVESHRLAPNVALKVDPKRRELVEVKRKTRQR